MNRGRPSTPGQICKLRIKFPAASRGSGAVDASAHKDTYAEKQPDTNCLFTIQPTLGRRLSTCYLFIEKLHGNPSVTVLQWTYLRLRLLDSNKSSHYSFLPLKANNLRRKATTLFFCMRDYYCLLRKLSCLHLRTSKIKEKTIINTPLVIQNPLHHFLADVI